MVPYPKLVFFGGLLIASMATTGCEPAPTGELLAFASGRSGNGDIYVASGDSSAPMLFVGSDAAEGSPRFDPAESRLVYTVFDSAGSAIFSDGVKLFDGPTEEFAPVWSTTGMIAYVDVSGDSTDLYVAASDFSNRTRITFDERVERYPAWHPNGNRLAFVARLDSGWDVFEMDIRTMETRRLTDDGVYVGHLAWSPRGDEIALDRSYGDQTEIAVLNVETGSIRRLTDNNDNDLVPAWSPDGRRVAFSGVRDGNWDVWTVSSDGGSPTRVTSHPAFDGGPVYLSMSASPEDRSSRNDAARLRALHAQLIQAHLDGDVDSWMSIEADTIVSANGGRVTFPRAVERRRGRTPYLENATFERYRDIRDPVVRISDDGSLGWLIAEVEVAGSYVNVDGSIEEIAVVWAWIELYERTGEGWKLVGNVSNSRPLE